MKVNPVLFKQEIKIPLSPIGYINKTDIIPEFGYYFTEEKYKESMHEFMSRNLFDRRVSVAPNNVRECDNIIEPSRIINLSPSVLFGFIELSYSDSLLIGVRYDINEDFVNMVLNNVSKFVVRPIILSTNSSAESKGRELCNLKILGFELLPMGFELLSID